MENKEQKRKEKVTQALKDKKIVDDTSFTVFQMTEDLKEYVDEQVTELREEFQKEHSTDSQVEKVAVRLATKLATLEKGNDGINGIDGKDGLDGKNGENYVLTNKDKYDIAKSIVVPIVEKEVRTIVEKTEVIRETPIVTQNIVEKALTDEPDIIAEKINTLKEKIEPDAIKGYRELEKLFRLSAFNPTMGPSFADLANINKRISDLSTGMGSISIGDSVTNGTNGSVLFINPTGVLAQDNSNFNYDKTSKQLLLGLTGSPWYQDQRVRLGVVGNQPDYADVAAQNQNSGSGATTDFFTSADNDSSTLTGHYTDFGITSSGYSGTNAGNIKSVTVNAQGTGYGVGNVLTITGGSNDGQVTVLTVGGSGQVTSVQVTNNGTGYTTGSAFSTTGGAGTGCTINITSLLDFSLWGANDGYLYNSGGNLILSSDTLGKSIKFSVGGIGATNELMRLNSVGISVNTSRDFTGTDSINTYAQIDAYLPNSLITNSLAGLNTDGATPGYTASSSRGTGISPIQVQAGDLMGGFSGWGAEGASSPTYKNLGGMFIYATGSSTNNLGGELRWYTKGDAGSLVNWLYLSNSGNLHLGDQVGGSTLVGEGARGLELDFSDNGNGGVALFLTNINSGTNAFTAINMSNDLANDDTFSHFAGMFYTSSGYTYTGFGTAFAVKNQLQLYGTDGPTLIGTLATGAAGYLNVVIGGAATTNEIARFTTVGMSIGAQATPTALLTVDVENIGSTAPTNAQGIILQNLQAATNTVNQNSPALTFRSFSWSTGSSASQDATWKIYSNAQISANASASLVIASATNGSGFTNRFTMTSAGTSTLTGSLSVSSGALTDTRTGIALTSTDGIINQNTTAATAGVTVQMSPRLRFSGTAWNTTPTAASNTINFIQEVLPVSGATTSGSLNWSFDNNGGGYTQIMSLSSGGNLGIIGKVTKYNNILTTGWGTPAIYGTGRTVGATAAVATVATYTVGASDGSFLVSANVLVTTSTTHAFTVTVAYTDEGNTSRVATLQFSNLAGTFITSIANAAGAVPYEGVPLQIRCKAGTAITIASAAGGVYTSVVYNIEGSITQIS